MRLERLFTFLLGFTLCFALTAVEVNLMIQMQPDPTDAWTRLQQMTLQTHPILLKRHAHRRFLR